MSVVTAKKLHAIAPKFSGSKRQRQAAIIAEVADVMDGALTEYSITSPRRICHFIAQIMHESAGMRTTEEFASGAAYEGRADLGNTQPGDGKRFKGRGLIQLTGRYNYRTYGSRLGIDLEANPALAAEPVLSLRIACEYWKAKGLNTYADRGDIRTITRRINGGYNGLADRRTYLGRAQSIFGNGTETILKGTMMGLLQPVEDTLQDRNYNITTDPNDIKLRFGMKNSMVGDLQKILNEKGYPCGSVDKHFGVETRRAVLGMKADSNMSTADEAISVNEARACKDREVSTERATAGVDHVIANSKTAENAAGAVKSNIGVIGAGVATGATALGIDSPESALDKVEQGQILIQRSQDVVERLTGGFVDVKTVLLVLGGAITVMALYGLYKSGAALMRRVNDYRSAKSLGH